MFNRVGTAPRGQPVRNARGGAQRLNGQSQMPGALPPWSLAIVDFVECRTPNKECRMTKLGVEQSSFDIRHSELDIRYSSTFARCAGYMLRSLLFVRFVRFVVSAPP